MQKRTTHSKILFKDNSFPENVFPPIVVAYNIKTPENIGNIIRLADNFGCSEVIIVSNDGNIRKSKIKKTAVSSIESVKWSICDPSELASKIPDGYKMVSIETSSDSKNIYNTVLPDKAVFIVGNEIEGLANDILNISDCIIHIPLYGKNSSMNVSHALAVVLFEWQRNRNIGL